jgi:hypothetical protein
MMLASTSTEQPWNNVTRPAYAARLVGSLRGKNGLLPKYFQRKWLGRSGAGDGKHAGKLMRAILLLSVMLLGCGSWVTKEPAFPAKVAPGWTRSAIHSIEATQFPPQIRSAGITQGWQTEYRAADGAVARVDAYAVRSNSQGLDLVQRWRPERNNAQFYTDHYLLNVAWQQANHDELASLVRSLPKLVEGR